MSKCLSDFNLKSILELNRTKFKIKFKFDSKFKIQT